MQDLVEWARSLWVVWLMLLFVGIVVWAYWPRNKPRFDADAQIPFRDEDGRESDSRKE